MQSPALHLSSAWPSDILFGKDLITSKLFQDLFEKLLTMKEGVESQQLDQNIHLLCLEFCKLI